MHPLDLTPAGCCECGCGSPVRGRFVHGHGGHSGGRPPIELDPATGCWEWFGKRDEAGYGRLRRGGRYWLAHRWVYSRLVRELDVADVLDHLCRNPRCVNPEHLEPTTDAENVRRGRTPKLSLQRVASLREEFAASGLSQRAWARSRAKELGVAEVTLRQALARYWGTPKRRGEAS